MRDNLLIDILRTTATIGSLLGVGAEMQRNEQLNWRRTMVHSAASRLLLITQAESRPISGVAARDQRIGLPADDDARKMRPEMKQDMRWALQLLMMPAASIVCWRCVISQAWPPYLGPLDGALISQTIWYWGQPVCRYRYCRQNLLCALGHMHNAHKPVLYTNDYIST